MKKTRLGGSGEIDEVEIAEETGEPAFERTLVSPVQAEQNPTDDDYAGPKVDRNARFARLPGSNRSY